jgi:hypothetical protein
MADFQRKAWWARQGLNLRPLRCEHSAKLRNPQKSAILRVPNVGTSDEQTAILSHLHRTCTGALSPLPGGLA